MRGDPSKAVTDYIRRFACPPPDQVNSFVAGARALAVAPGKALVELGDVTHQLYFVHSGTIRYMLVLPNSGDDVTKDFSSGPTFAVSYGSAVSKQPARVGIVTVTDCILSVWPFEQLTALYARDPEWQKLGRLLAERLYVRKEDREIAFLTQTAEQRFVAFGQEFPGVASLLPQRHIASYLGITPESLSRLKARISTRN
jgi:CRP-like cAMP-binding protein